MVIDFSSNLVPPSPSYIVMDGCSTGLCSVVVNETKALTCTVTGARPPVLLQWHIIDEEKITITNQDYDERKNMGLYDTIASLQFEITTEASCGDILTATCQATGPATELFRPSKDQRFEGKISFYPIVHFSKASPSFLQKKKDDVASSKIPYHSFAWRNLDLQTRRYNRH